MLLVMFCYIHVSVDDVHSYSIMGFLLKSFSMVALWHSLIL